MVCSYRRKQMLFVLPQEAITQGLRRSRFIPQVRIYSVSPLFSFYYCEYVTTVCIHRIAYNILGIFAWRHHSEPTGTIQRKYRNLLGTCLCFGVMPGSYDIDWGCSPCSAAGPLQSTRIVLDRENDFQGIVGYSSNINAIVIGFRGSSNIRNWITNFTVLKKKAYEAYPEALVHQGFYQLYPQVAEQVVHHVEKIRNEHANAVILVTGHSLGGAIAMICAFELALLHGLNVEALHTFGQPRVGNYAFAKAVQDLVPRLYRVIQSDDIIVHFPPTVSDFRHSGIEVLYDKKNSKHIESAAVSPVKTNIAHLNVVSENASASKITTITCTLIWGTAYSVEVSPCANKNPIQKIFGRLHILAFMAAHLQCSTSIILQQQGS